MREEIELNLEIHNGRLNESLTPELTAELETARETVLHIARRYVNLPSAKYIGPESGCTLEEGFTCSGLILVILKEAKYALPHLVIPDGVVHASEMFDRLGILIHPGFAKPGDLVFSSRPSGIKPNHVGLYLYDNPKDNPYMLSSPGRDGKVIGFAPIKQLNLKITDNPQQIYTHNPVGYKRLTLATGHPRWPQMPIF